jgi:hypothetical protein
MALVDVMTTTRAVATIILSMGLSPSPPQRPQRRFPCEQD